MKNIEPKTLKGFRDFLPQEARKRQFVIRQLAEVFESYGFEPLETPALEYEEILLGKYGEEGDKLMYRFVDNGGRKVALRYDQTVPLARVIAQYGSSLPMPFKRYQIQPVWRAENTQKGRLREFLQCDIDTVGSPSLSADAEIINVAVSAVRKLGFKSIKMLINDRFIFSHLKSQFVSAIDKLEKIGKEAVVEELVAKGMNRLDAKRQISSFDDSKPPPNVLTLFDRLEKLGLVGTKDFAYKASLARGLNYYTSIIFELISEDYNSGSIGGGGRYDNLIGMFAGRDIPAVGFSFGFDRLMEAMEELKLFPNSLNESITKVLVTVFDKSFVEQSLEVCSQLRSNNINTEIWLDAETKLDKQIKYADKKGIPFVIIIGPEEMEENKVKIKNLKTRIQEKIEKEKLNEYSFYSSSETK